MSVLSVLIGHKILDVVLFAKFITMLKFCTFLILANPKTALPKTRILRSYSTFSSLPLCLQLHCTFFR